LPFSLLLFIRHGSTLVDDVSNPMTRKDLTNEEDLRTIFSKSDLTEFKKAVEIFYFCLHIYQEEEKGERHNRAKQNKTPGTYQRPTTTTTTTTVDTSYNNNNNNRGSIKTDLLREEGTFWFWFLRRVFDRISFNRFNRFYLECWK